MSDMYMYKMFFHYVEYSMFGKMLICHCIFLNRLKKVFADSESEDWNAAQQGSMQAVSLAVTLGMALFGGLVTGWCTVCMWAHMSVLACVCVRCSVIS